MIIILAEGLFKKSFILSKISLFFFRHINMFIHCLGFWTNFQQERHFNNSNQVSDDLIR